MSDEHKPEMSEVHESLGRPKWICFDCETTGIHRKRPDGSWMRADDPDAPRLAGITMIWTTPGLAFVGQKTLFIKPEGWYMPKEAGRVNGLTTEFLMENGRPIEEAVDIYDRAINAGYAFSSFNIQFDTKIMRGEFRRLRKPDRYADIRTFCVMKGNIGVCKLPRKDGKAYKQPKLSEALAHWKIPQTGAHTSAGDAHAVLALLRCLDNAGIDITPKTHISREDS